MTIRVAREFQTRWSCFWATTYDFHPTLFEEHLFRRLGDPPLNANVLVDFDQLAGVLAHVADDDRVARRANRDYLLRGVKIGGAFHPKTYFFADEWSGTLLVGSGNLTIYGIEEGREVFVRFDSRVPQELDGIRAWRDWTDRIVARLGDPELTHRWADLRRRVPWLAGTVRRSQFVSNLDVPFIDQLCAGMKPPIDELHVLAPYYDREAKALQLLVQRLRPRALHIYVGARTSVDGKALTQVLDKSKARVSISSFDPATFVHAKLIAAIDGKRARLLSGSANLSQAALAATPAREAWANIEAGVLLDADADGVRTMFQPADLELRPVPLAMVMKLKFSAADQPPGQPLALRAARLVNDGRIEVEYEGDITTALFVTAGLGSQRLVARRSAAAVARPEDGALVWLCARDGSVLSNRVPVDEPSRLRGWLEERDAATDGPRELDATDASTPVGRMLQYLHGRCIFDIDETPAARRARNASGVQTDSGDQGWDFLDQLIKEELRYDSRIERYRSTVGSDLPIDDDIVALIRTMLERTPAPWHLRGVGTPGSDTASPGSGERWTPERRLQLRLFNLLERWCGALNDPRFAWIDHAAPARNYSALLVALAECWEQHYLPEDKVVRLLETLFSSFVTGDGSPGFLLRLSEPERAATLSQLPEEARTLGAALAYSALRPLGAWAKIIFEWQPFLSADVQLGVIAVSGDSTDMVKRLTGEAPSPATIMERLRWACTVTNDEHWCEKQERDLGFKSVEIVYEKFHARFGIVLSVDGVHLDDPKLVTLVRRALAYRGTSGVIVRFGSGLLSVVLGERLYAREYGPGGDSTERVTGDMLATLEASGATLTQLVAEPGAVAS